ncbi:hypothetical protein RGR602_CH00884 [Rhizobium gallicum bv. gallicum R602sp]|uniref:Uncharacterized protein n=1 Tax=Rhizobium gallicum bv. gallicum R602sp TaxID=1041138 RepID=A0A0B4X0D6_9HYPH|nr:hypothetical protein [Rhizobium gallicum]AJD40245.1 hypothetical protein RGR602_CH00884 [Rhizobium gallicum bv. gallicum R602sp]
MPAVWNLDPGGALRLALACRANGRRRMFAQVKTAFHPRWRAKTILERASIAARIYRSFSPNGNGFFGVGPSSGQDGSTGYFAGKRRMRSTRNQFVMDCAWFRFAKKWFLLDKCLFKRNSNICRTIWRHKLRESYGLVAASKRAKLNALESLPCACAAANRASKEKGGPKTALS